MIAEMQWLELALELTRKECQGVASPMGFKGRGVVAPAARRLREQEGELLFPRAV